MNTFDYCGINSSTFGVYYVPDEAARFDDRADYEVYADTADWHDGGVYYGNTLKPREFTMSCYFEQIDRKTKQRMMEWLGRNTCGRLVFEDTPWKYYLVRPTKKLTGKEFSHRPNGDGKLVYSGTFVITFTAYEPWGFLRLSDLDAYCEYYYQNADGNWDPKLYAVDSAGRSYEPQLDTVNDTILYAMDGEDSGAQRETVYDYLNIIQPEDMPQVPDVNSRTLYLYNCGNEITYPVIRLGGAADGITLTNTTNNTACRMLSLPESGHVQIDCGKGIVTVVNGADRQTDFSQHDLGYIRLEPCGMMNNDVTVHHTQGSNEVQISGRFGDDSLIGKCLLIGHAWYRILRHDGQNFVISGTPDTTGQTVTNIVTMNRIQVSGSDIDLNMFQIEFVPHVN